MLRMYIIYYNTGHDYLHRVLIHTTRICRKSATLIFVNSENRASF